MRVSSQAAGPPLTPEVRGGRRRLPRSEAGSGGRGERALAPLDLNAMHRPRGAGGPEGRPGADSPAQAEVGPGHSSKGWREARTPFGRAEANGKEGGSYARQRSVPLGLDRHSATPRGWRADLLEGIEGVLLWGLPSHPDELKDGREPFRQGLLGPDGRRLVLEGLAQGRGRRAPGPLEAGRVLQGVCVDPAQGRLFIRARPV